MANTKIVVLQRKKIMYLGIIAFVCIAFLIIFLVCIGSKKGENTETSLSLNTQKEQLYEPGVYTKEIKLGEANFDLKLTLDESHIKSVEIINLEDSVETMYPLMRPTIEKISKELSSGKSMDEIALSKESRYTEKALVESVSQLINEHKKK